VAITQGGSVAVRESGGVGGFAGLATCGSVWACGVCNAKIMARRQLEIGAAVEAWRSSGGSVVFGTQTMRHWQGHRLTDLWVCLSKAWGKVTSGSSWVRDKKRHGIVGWLRVVEVTFGANGWHVHIHSLLFLEASTVATDLDALKGSIFGRWSAALKSLGLPAPLLAGQDLHVLDGAADEALAGYFTKAVHSAKAIGLEMTSTQTKTARGVHKTFSVWKFLDDVIDLGDADALGHWQEFQRASKGRRQLTWSKGLRELLGLRAEKSDEDVAGEELGTKADDLVLITAAGWRQVIACMLMVPILEMVERQGLSGVRALLDVSGVEYELIGERAA
jgi:Replication protein.